MPAAHNPVLERRTVDNANQNLLKYLKSGLSVLDAGCGSGANYAVPNWFRRSI